LTQENEEQTGKHDPYAALKYRDFRLLLIGRFLAGVGDQMVGVALGWELYERTGDAFYLGLMGLVEVTPVILLSLPAGHLADHASRRKIVLITKSSLAVISLLLAFCSASHSPLWLFFTCILGIGIARAYQSPASSNLIQLTVPPELYTNAITWNNNLWQLSAAIGPAVGGLIIAVSKQAMPVYIMDAFFGLAYVIAVLNIRGKEEIKARTAATWDSVKEGMRFLKHSPILLSVITLDLFAVLLGGAVALLPVFAKDILHVGPVGLGWMRAMPSIGAVLMALTIAHRPPFQKAGMTMLLAVAGFGAATIIFGLSKSFPLSLAMLFLLGAFDNISVVIRSTLLMVRTPDSMRGRVSAVNSVFIGASNELGAFESGFAARLMGTVGATVFGGVGTILVVIIVALMWPELRKLKTMQADVAPNDRGT